MVEMISPQAGLELGTARSTVESKKGGRADNG